jgi:hypothetical protein
MTQWHLTASTFIYGSKSCFKSEEALASLDTLMAQEISYHLGSRARNKSPVVVAGS